MINTDTVKVKINGEVVQRELSEYTACGVLFTHRKIKVDSGVGSTLVNFRKDLQSSDVYLWEYNRLNFKTVVLGNQQYITEFRCEDDYYEVLQYNSEIGISEDNLKMFE